MTAVKLTIDGQEVQVEAGATVLEAASRLGIEIPTLCFVRGLEPAASCFVCAVEVEGRAALAPSCALPAAEGMAVKTRSEEVLATRKLAIELILSDHAGDCIAPCQATCPAGLDIPGFTLPLASGEIRQAIETIFAQLALPGSLGRICPRLCESSCRRCGLDESLAIGALHRHAADRDLASSRPFLPPRSEPTGKKVGIIGAGPAGLAAAFFLLRQGPQCVLFDAHERPGGMLRYGIPAFRLPRAALDAEIELIRRLGAVFRMSRRWGRDFTLGDLRRDFDAVFIAIGAQRARGLGCAGEELALSGLEFLEAAAVGRAPALGERVIVVGGGNTAVDACRTARRLGARAVRLLYRRERADMPCLMEEVEGAEAEGIELLTLAAPKRLERLPAGPLRMICARMRPGEPDRTGRRSPVEVPGSEFSLEADTAIAALGQAVELETARADGLEVTGHGIAAHPRTLATNLEGVFAGGDGVSGPDLAVRAVAAGRAAAAAIDQYLRGRPVVGEPRSVNVQLRPLDEAELAALFRSIDPKPRVHGRRLELELRRTTFRELDAGLGDEAAVREARRCLTCGCRKAGACELRRLATEFGAEPYRFRGERRRFSRDESHASVIYEPGKCILCNACVQAAEAAGEELGLAIVGRGFEARMAVPFEARLAEGLTRSAGRCAEVCPTGALALRGALACEACALRPAAQEA